MRPHSESNMPLVATWLSIIALLVALTAVFYPRSQPAPQTSGPTPQERPLAVDGLLERIERTAEIHAGYGVYPPYTKEDPTTRKVSGFSVDIIEQIAKELHCKVVWHRLNWNTMSADLKRGEYDVIADPIFQTIPRAREFAFTEPYAYFADGIAVVRTDEARFTDFSSLDQPGVTIAVGQGWASENLLKVRFSKAKINTVQTASDLLQVFNEVLSGRADVVVADGADVRRFLKEHPKSAKALWLDNPPAYMPAGFALKPTDKDGASFLTVCLRNMRSTGAISALERKYEVPSLSSPPSGTP